MDQLLIALDVPTGGEALRLADSLRGAVGGFKIGKRLFTAEGPVILRTLAAKGDRVFLDLKYHDIPNTVAQAVAAATSLGAWMINVHASGGRRMMEAAVEAARATARAEGRARTARDRRDRPDQHECRDAGGIRRDRDRARAGGAAGPPRAAVWPRWCGGIPAGNAGSARAVRAAVRDRHARHPRRSRRRAQGRSGTDDDGGGSARGGRELYRGRAADHRRTRPASVEAAERIRRGNPPVEFILR